MGEVIVSDTGVISIPDSSVTSAKIASDTIVNANVNSAAAIAATKIAGTALVKSEFDAKGDIITGSANDTSVRTAVGVATTHPFLVPDTTASGGVAWKSWADANVANDTPTSGKVARIYASLSRWETTVTTLPASLPGTQFTAPV